MGLGIMTTGRPRVVLVTRIFDPEPAAAAFRLAALARALVDSGAEVEVLTTRPPAGLVAHRMRGVRVRRWPVLRDGNDYVRGYLPYLSFDVPLALRLLLVPRPHVVVAEPPPTTGAVVRAVCALRRIPYVAYLPDVWSDGAEATGASGVIVRAVRALERFVLRGAARVIAVTDEIHRRAVDLSRIPADVVALVRNGVDTDTFTPEGERYPTAPEGPYAVYAGTISEWQGADVFVRAWASVLEQVPAATLIYLGQGSHGQELADLVRALPDGGASVRLLPLVSAPEAAAWQRGAAVTLVSMKPEQRYDYFLPTKLFAGLACGTPVLYAGPGPGAALVVGEGFGRAVANEPGEVAAAMVAMLVDLPPQAERSRLADWVRQHASSRTSGAHAAQVVLEAARGTTR